MNSRVNRGGGSWLTVSMIARRLAVSERFIYKLIETKELPAVRLHRAVRVPEDAFERWLADKEAAAKDSDNDFGNKARAI